jgi:hypothetical protein
VHGLVTNHPHPAVSAVSLGPWEVMGDALAPSRGCVSASTSKAQKRVGTPRPWLLLCVPMGAAWALSDFGFPVFFSSSPP